MSSSAPSPAIHSTSPSFKEAIRARLVYALGKTVAEANERDWYVATALAVRDRITELWLDIRPNNKSSHKKRVYYLSIEFLIGRLLSDSLANLGLTEEARVALASFDVDLQAIQETEPDAALGNGGLGRLAACYMDSMTSLGIPAYGYGIRYEHGLFAQTIRDGWQEERPEQWLKSGNPWELPRPEKEYAIGFGGAVEYVQGRDDTPRAIWYPGETVIATTHDIPLIGWKGAHANVLRLWGARAPDPIQLSAFNEGDHVGAMAARIKAEAITRILYPNDQTPQGLELRLRQEYFFTAASLRDIVRRHMEQIGDIRQLADYAAIQLNDTHPAIAVAELMRVLIDEHDLNWNEAWTLTRATISFTNHTLMPEALEKWSLSLFGRVLPRHLQIIYLINWHHLEDATRRGLTDAEFIANISLIDESGDRSIRMAHLAFVGSHHVNGVSALHTELLKATVFRDLAKAAPTRIVNKTNGVTFHRWLFQANPALTALISEAAGRDIREHPDALRSIEGFSDDAGYRERAERIRRANKERLATLIRSRTGISVDPGALFDVHVKRIHEYKRQTLNLLETIALYAHIRANPGDTHVPRVKIIAGKAAPGYQRAKLLIKLAHDVAHVINSDPIVADRLKLVFIPNYNVSLAEAIVPAADLSEQISTAGMEASGTGNMKLALNGALTIGTLDGANIEIRDHVGAEHFFLFGMTADEVEQRRHSHYEGIAAARESEMLQTALQMCVSGAFAPDDPARYSSLVEALLGADPFMVAADFSAYWASQREVDRAWLDRPRWWRSSILNTARMGWFNSDRAVREYAAEIWNVPVRTAE
jgi:starch phosphorylase